MGRYCIHTLKCTTMMIINDDDDDNQSSVRAVSLMFVDLSPSVQSYFVTWMSLYWLSRVDPLSSDQSPGAFDLLKTNLTQRADWVHNHE